MRESITSQLKRVREEKASFEDALTNIKKAVFGRDHYSKKSSDVIEKINIDQRVSRQERERMSVTMESLYAENARLWLMLRIMSGKEGAFLPDELALFGSIPQDRYAQAAMMAPDPNLPNF